MKADSGKVLRRELGLIDAIAVGFGAIIGAGIFVVSGIAAATAGPLMLAGLVIAAMVATFNALSSAQLAARFPTSGGTYEYGYQLVHPWAGFSAGWTFLASKIAAGGTVAIGFGSYCSQLFPAIPAQAAGAAAVILLTGANYIGIKKAGKLNILIVCVTMAVLISFVVLALFHVKPNNFTPFAPKGYGTVLQSAAIMFFAYTGYARIATLAEEVKEPEKTIPRAIVISLGVSVALYFLVSFVAVGAIGADAMGASRTPLVRVAEGIGSPHLGLIVSIGAGTAMLGVLLSQILGISRVMLAMARRNDLPGILEHVNDRFGVPDRAIFATGSVILVLALFGSLDWVISTATFTILLYYTVTNIAALRLEKQDSKFPDAIAWLGLASCLCLAGSLKLETIAAGMILLGMGFGLRSILRWVKKTDAPTA